VQIQGRHQTYVAEDTPFNQGGAGRLHRCLGAPLVYKHYRNEVRDRTQATQLERVYQIGRDVLGTGRQAPGSTPEASVNWPVDIILHRWTGGISGVILPMIPAEFFLANGHTRTLDHLLLQRASPPPASVRVAVLLRLAEIFRYVDHKQLVHGDLSAKNVVWRPGPEPGAYLIDVDGLQPQRPPPTTGLATPQWTDPRLVEGRIPAHDHFSDWYALALAMYRGLLLNPGILDRQADGTWRRPRELPRDLDRSIAKLLMEALGRPLDETARASPALWATTLYGAFVTNGRFNDHKLTVLDSHAAQRAAATQAIQPQPRLRPRAQPRPKAQPSPGYMHLPAQPPGYGQAPAQPAHSPAWPAGVGPPGASPPGPSPPYRYPPAPRKRPEWLGLLAIAVLAALILLVVTRLNEPNAASGTASPARSSSQTAPATTPPPTKSPTANRWIAQLASVRFDQGRPKRDAIAKRIGNQVPGARVLTSNDFASLRPNHWVVYHPGPFSSGLEVLDFCDQHGRSVKDACLGRWLSHSKDDMNRQCFREPDRPDGTPTPACTS
jgi:hypothetical protein